MPSIQLEVAHAQGEQGAIERLKAKGDSLRIAFQGQVSDLVETWEGNRLQFAFKAMGMGVSGSLVVEDAKVAFSANLPFAAMMFKGMILERVRSELTEVLA